MAVFDKTPVPVNFSWPVPAMSIDVKCGAPDPVNFSTPTPAAVIFGSAGVPDPVMVNVPLVPAPDVVNDDMRGIPADCIANGMVLSVIH
jgi:hypothetical protein